MNTKMTAPKIDVLARLDAAGDTLFSTGREDLIGLADELADVRKAMAELIEAQHDLIDSQFAMARAAYNGICTSLYAEDCARANVRLVRALLNVGSPQ